MLNFYDVIFQLIISESNTGLCQHEMINTSNCWNFSLSRFTISWSSPSRTEIESMHNRIRFKTMISLGIWIIQLVDEISSLYMKILTLHAGKYYMYFLSSADLFFKIIFFQKIFQILDQAQTPTSKISNK